MNLLSRSKEEPEINLTSLIDVVLLLLVFFMVSTSFVREAEINIQLPEANVDPVERIELEELEVGITQTGNYILNGRPLVDGIDAAGLRRAIEQILGENRDVDVTIRADAESTHQANITAITVLGELGFSSVNFATMTASGSQ